MRKITISTERFTGGSQLLSRDGEDSLIRFPKAGGGILLPELINCPQRYAVFWLHAKVAHSVTVNLFVYPQNAPDAAHCFTIRFGVLPDLRTLICIDRNWMDAHVLFPETNPGQLKVVCHGGRVDLSEVGRITFETAPCFEDVELIVSDIELTDQRPTEFPLPDIKLIDEFGQAKGRTWAGKVHSTEELQERLNAAMNLSDAYAIDEWNRYGGHGGMPLMESTGYFSKTKKDGRWWLTDPLGCAFFSMGPDCVGARSGCRIDGIEKFMDWLPDPTNPIYGPMYKHQPWPQDERRRDCTLFSFERANLYRAFGDDWYPQWQALMSRQLKQGGMNTLGNWSDENIKGKIAMPYVTQLPNFPTAKTLIFRDFPDVLSEEYAKNAKTCAEYLRPLANDPYMIGYFLRNEPAWAFVDHLVLADEVLLNPWPSCCKRELIATLKAQYGDIETLNAAWNLRLTSFDELNSPIAGASKLSSAAREDLRAFSRRLLNAYVTIPSKACRVADPNHMNLGMRWAWISDPDLVTGWENFDVFSINCYAVDPTSAIENVVNLGVDLPVLIGEFHFGALDGALSATGLEGVRTQADRGRAYRYYTERVAAHPSGVGCHYFQCYDQFELGRFDGENYNIGLFNICSLPYPEMMAAVKACSQGIYGVAAGKTAPTGEKPESIPMIAY